MKFHHSLLFAASFVVLTGCGGGGDSAPGPGPVAPPPSAGPSPTCTEAEAFSAVADATIAVGKAAGAVLAGCTGPLTDIQWTQTGGPTVSLMSAKTQAISFEPSSPATYTFSVSFRDATGVPRTASVSTTASIPATSAAVLARVDQAVREGGNVSLRAWPPAASGETITWLQTAGPQVTLNTSDPNRVLFVAPEVIRDTALVFRATRQGTTGATDSDDVLVLVENHAQAPADQANSGPYLFSGFHVSRVYPYRPNGPFAGVLVPCTYDASLQYTGPAANSCPLSTLPLLHQTTNGAVPTLSQIMDRVVVSHDWMGEVFEEFVRTQLATNEDMKRLFNGVTAIVIGAQVRPSFYYGATGAIYLDAANFWLTAEQRDVINEAPDFRSGFDRDLNYSSVWRYTEGNQTILVNFPSTSRVSRSQSYLLAEAAWLLYHELAHASDFFPPGRRASLNAGLPPLRNIAPPLPSDSLSSAFPLQSVEMRALAEVKFRGAAATPTQQAYTPDMVASFFAPDGATDDYSYHPSTREDPAMLFEEFMMFRNHGWRRNFAITDKIAPSTTSATLTVRWGQRGRIGEAAIKPRATLVVDALAPWVPAAEVQGLPPPIQMRPGESWAANLALPAPSGQAGIQSIRILDAESDRALLLRSMGPPHGPSNPNERRWRRGER